VSIVSQTPDITGRLKVNTRVHIYDVRQIHPVSYDLARELDVRGDESITSICMRNAAACARAGRRSLAQMWELVAKSADPNVIDKSTWAYHPMGKKLIERFIEKYLKLSDVQTVAILSCVLMLRREDGSYDHWLLDHNMERLYRYVRSFYADVLHRWGFDCQRSEILKFNATNELDSRALKCGIELDDSNDESRKTSFHCSICRLPVRGLNMICVVCGHGGHANHMRMWFSKHDTCATGCMCHCVQHMGEYPQSNSATNLPTIPNPLSGHASTATNVIEETLHDMLHESTESNGSNGTPVRRARSIAKIPHHHHGRYPPDLAPLNTSPPHFTNPLSRSVSQDEMGTEEAQSAPSKRISHDFIRPTPVAATPGPTRHSSKASFPYFRIYQY
jgi:hypothetical protein